MNNKKYVETISKCAESSLDRIGEYYEFSDETFVDISIIFNEILLSKVYETNKDKLEIKEMTVLAGKCGADFRKLILKYTGKDMHTLAKNLGNEKK